MHIFWFCLHITFVHIDNCVVLDTDCRAALEAGAAGDRTLIDPADKWQWANREFRAFLGKRAGDAGRRDK